ncbi:MAG: thiamine-phosphate kinase [Proteobacteria bacterium]|nr:thiamine-phosphate kinase [Pseudomonadota bacterium]
MTSSSSKGPPEKLGMGEFEIIAKFFAPLATDPGAFGLKDDVASVQPRAGHELILKTDAIVAGVHFLPGDPADLVARKALRVNLSDLAAKGAEPAGYLLSLSLSAQTQTEWIARFAQGLAEDQKVFAISLLGGDTTSTSGPTTVSVTAVGWMPLGTIPRRSGAKPGDLVFVSGSIGDAGAGLALLKGEKTAPQKARDALVSRYRLPQPRLALGLALRGLARATIDVSDGLLADLGHIAQTSGVRISIEASAVPLSPSLVEVQGKDQAAIVRAATAGDDYEIAFTAPAAQRDAVMQAAAQTNTPVTEIGRVEAGEGAVLLDTVGNEISVSRTGYTHF